MDREREEGRKKNRWSHCYSPSMLKLRKGMRKKKEKKVKYLNNKIKDYNKGLQFKLGVSHGILTLVCCCFYPSSSTYFRWECNWPENESKLCIYWSFR